MKNKPEQQRIYNVISVFSGAMGLDIGVEHTSRFRVIACLEKDPAFCETIRANRDAGRLDPEIKVFEGDIKNIDPLDVLKATGLAPGQVDLLVGGPPCQSFSTAGRRRTIQDPRGTLLWDFLRYVEAMRPRFFLMENVRGLLSAALQHRPISARPEKGGLPLDRNEMPGSVVRMFAEDLGRIQSASYHVDCFEVNAVNYGAPQLRERVLFIGNRYNDLVEFPDPTHGPVTDNHQQQWLFDEARPRLRPWRTLGDAIGTLDHPGEIIMDFSPRKKAFLSLVPPGSNWRSLPIDVQKESMGRAWYAKGGRSGWWRRLNFDLPCPTLVTMPNHAGTSLCHPTEIRALTLREYALVQEFPSDWEFRGTPAEQYAQVGNAVPVRLGKVAGNVIVARLDALASRCWRLYQKHMQPYRIIYVQSHVRTRQWYKAGKTFLWNDGKDNADARYQPPQKHRRESAL